MFEIVYHYLAVEEDIPGIDSDWKAKIEQAIEEKLGTRSDVHGKPLRRSFKGYRKLRVGDYRVIHRIEKKKVKVFVVQHRSAVYAAAEKRI